MRVDVGDDTDRPQDAGRRHRGRGAPSAETVALLAEYQEAMRAELRAVLAEQRGRLPDRGILPVAEDEQPAQLVRPSLADRVKLWELAIKLGRELGAEIDPRPAGRGPAPAGNVVPMRRRGRIDYGPE